MERYELPEILYKKIHIVEPYPEIVKPVDKMIDITAFFPGGKGLWLEEETDILPTILVLGKDFSNVEEYKSMLRSESNDLKCTTWRNLRKLFKEANIDLKNCFYSNVFMGLRVANKSTGDFPWFKDKSFVRRNLEFLLYQIEIIKPKVIITLGRPASEMISKLSQTDLKCWKDGKALSEENNGLKTSVSFNNHICTCVALEHTSMNHFNINRRVYVNKNGKHYGHTAEVEMLKDATNNI